MRHGTAALYRCADASGSNAKKRGRARLKIAIPFICLLIALFGAPLAISRVPRAARPGGSGEPPTTFIVC